MKTNPIGVRFRTDILEKLKADHNAETPQMALNFLERFYVTHHAIAKDLKQPLRSNVESEVVKPIVQENKNEAILSQIQELEKELKNPPKNLLIGQKAWRRIREQKIQELKLKLNDSQNLYTE